MVAREVSTGGRSDTRQSAFPMEDTAQALNDRLQLYLSEGQQRGLAVGLLLGTVLASAALAWAASSAVRRRW